MRYRFNLLNAQHFYRSHINDYAPTCILLAGYKYGFDFCPVPIKGASPYLELTGSAKEVGRIVQKLNLEYGFCLEDISEVKIDPKELVPLEEIFKELKLTVTQQPQGVSR